MPKRHFHPQSPYTAQPQCGVVPTAKRCNAEDQPAKSWFVGSVEIQIQPTRSVDAAKHCEIGQYLAGASDPTVALISWSPNQTDGPP